MTDYTCPRCELHTWAPLPHTNRHGHAVLLPQRGYRTCPQCGAYCRITRGGIDLVRTTRVVSIKTSYKHKILRRRLSEIISTGHVVCAACARTVPLYDVTDGRIDAGETQIVRVQDGLTYQPEDTLVPHLATKLIPKRVRGWICQPCQTLPGYRAVEPQSPSAPTWNVKEYLDKPSHEASAYAVMIGKRGLFKRLRPTHLPINSREQTTQAKRGLEYLAWCHIHHRAPRLYGIGANWSGTRASVDRAGNVTAFGLDTWLHAGAERHPALVTRPSDLRETYDPVIALDRAIAEARRIPVRNYRPPSLPPVVLSRQLRKRRPTLHADGSVYLRMIDSHTGPVGRPSNRPTFGE